MRASSAVLAKLLSLRRARRRMTSCASAADCSYNGRCSSGACICDPGWNGTRCASIRWSASGAHRAFNDSLWTWGGSPVRGPDGLIHLFASELSNDCGVLHYCSNSRVVHLTATSPLGPFTRRTVALAPRPPPAWDSGAVHGPTVHALPGGRGWALYYTGTRPNWNGTHPNCTAGVDPNQGDRTTRRIGIATSASLYGPWTRRDAPIFEPADRAAGAWDWLDVSNPTPILFANGTALLLYKGRGHLQAPLGLGSGLRMGLGLGLRMGLRLGLGLAGTALPETRSLAPVLATDTHSQPIPHVCVQPRVPWLATAAVVVVAGDGRRARPSLRRPLRAAAPRGTYRYARRRAMWKTRPVWPASTALAADWPRLTEA